MGVLQDIGEICETVMTNSCRRPAGEEPKGLNDEKMGEG